MAADLNARHHFIGHTDNNQTGNVLNSLIQRGLVTYLGPDFNTRVANQRVSRPDITLKNQRAYMNYSIREGKITSSDYLPIIMKISINSGSG